MIKAKKGLLIALFAAMMVFAFGATSVFANDYKASDVYSGVNVTEADWNADVTQVNVAGETYKLDPAQNYVVCDNDKYGFEGEVFVEAANGQYCYDTTVNNSIAMGWASRMGHQQGTYVPNGQRSTERYNLVADPEYVIDKTPHYTFDYMTPEQIAELKAKFSSENRYYMVLEDVGETLIDDAIVVNNRAMVVYEKYQGSSDFGRYVVGNPQVGGLDLGWYPDSNKVAFSKKIVDMNNQAIFDGNGSNYSTSSVNAGDYSAWLALKDLADTDAWKAELIGTEDAPGALANAAKAWTVKHVFKNEENAYYDKMWTAEYSAYDAFSYDTEKKADKKVTVTVTPDVDAIKAYVGLKETDAKNIIVLDTPAVIELEAVAGDLGRVSYDYWTAWDLPQEDTQPIEGWYWDTYYDGAEHAVAFEHVGEAVTVKYAAFAIDSKLSDGTVVKENTPASALKDADWADSAAIKDAGDYRVFVKMSMDRYPKGTVENGKLFLGADNFTIEKFPIAMGFLQKQLKAEYGKYDKASLEAAVKNLFMYSNNAPDAKDAIAQVVDKYGVVVGLFTDAGKGDLYADIDRTALAADAALSEAVKNYSFDDIYVTEEGDLALARGLAKVGVPCISMELEITQIANKVNFASKTKIYHVKKAKKLKKAKSFQLKATATTGDVKFVKIGGTSKLKVSSTGKVTVKKGTKKGTYKIQVKAYVDGTANYASADQVQTIKVKIKK
jgi:hypothetical protein